jgi:hypothetical protein
MAKGRPGRILSTIVVAAAKRKSTPRNWRDDPFADAKRRHAGRPAEPSSTFMRTVLTTCVAIAIAPGAVAAGSSPAFNRQRLVDSGGKTIGTVIGILGGGTGGVFVLRKVGGNAVLLQAEADAVFGSVNEGGFLHETTDCSGTRFLRVIGPKILIRDTTTIDSSGSGAGPLQHYFAGDPIEPHTMQSVEKTAALGECTPVGGTLLGNGFCCFSFGSQAQTLPAGPANLAIDTSKLRPPFSIR